MIYILIGIVGILALVLLYQVGGIFDLIPIIKGDKDKDEYVASNKFNALFFLGFIFFFAFIIIWPIYEYEDFFLTKFGSASEHGEIIDSQFNITLLWTGIIFVITQIALFYFAFRYKKTKKNNKAYYFPENTKLELAWTIIPGIVLLGLLVLASKSWTEITSDAPDDAVEIEVTGYQFGWTIRYPGPDGVLGNRIFKAIDATNILGMDTSDIAAYDDFLASELHLPLNKPVLIRIRSKDVLHAFFLPHFRVKMDAVPGTPTRFWFIPKITTEQMRERTGDENFNYELACAELCGAGHFGMLKIVVVDDSATYQKWFDSQTPFFEVTGLGQLAMNK